MSENNTGGAPSLLSMMFLISILPITLFFLIQRYESHDPRDNFEVIADQFVVDSFEYTLQPPSSLNDRVDGKLESCILPKGTRISHPQAYGRNKFTHGESSAHFNVSIPMSVNIENTGCPASNFTYFAHKQDHIAVLKNTDSIKSLGLTTAK